MASFAKNLSTSIYTQHKDSREFQTYHRLFLEYKNHITGNRGDLAKFLPTILDMVSILLNMIHATRCGRSIILYAFAYDHLDYASVNLFRRIEADQVIEATINKESKCPEGWKEFSAKADTVTLWVKSATHRASLKHELHLFVNLGSRKNLQKDLSKTRIEKDLKGVQEIVHLLEEVFIHPFAERGLVSLSSGIIVTTDIKDDLMNTYSLGKKAMDNFINERLSENGSVDFL